MTYECTVVRQCMCSANVSNWPNNQIWNWFKLGGKHVQHGHVRWGCNDTAATYMQLHTAHMSNTRMPHVSPCRQLQPKCCGTGSAGWGWLCGYVGCRTYGRPCDIATIHASYWHT